MSHHKDFKDESQDARRHDQQKEVHPDEHRHYSDKKAKHGSKDKDKK